MSCDSNANKVAKMVGQMGSGISQLASKRSFYAGVALGAAGTGLGVLIVSKLRRPKSISQPTLVRVGPAGKTPNGNGWSDTQTPRRGSRTNPLPLPNLEAATTVSGSRANPRPLPNPEALHASGSRANPAAIPVLSARPPETKLQKAALKVQTSAGEPFAPKNSYRVVRPDGSDTGLAVTPHLQENEKGLPLESESSWCVTHTSTGALVSGPYETVSKAHTLATQLSVLRWTAAAVPGADVEKARQIIAGYEQSLKDQGKNVL
jgi:hypothetical protein